MKGVAGLRSLNHVAFFLSLLMILPGTSLGECTCDPSDLGTNSGTLNYKILALVLILVASAVGVCIPMLGKIFPAVSPDKDAFFLVKSFAAGVILATGFIHVLPDAFDKLTSPCLSENPWGKFPFTGFVAMLATMGTLMVDAYATSYYTKRQFSKGTSDQVGDEEKDASAGREIEVGHINCQAEAHAHSHVHGLGDAHIHAQISGQAELLRHRVISQVLELGIIVHSVIIGMSIGTSGSLDTIKPLMAAVTFHQFFEGMGLGGCICQAKFKSRAAAIMAIFFSLTTPVGIAIGIGVSTSYDENSQTALIVEGVMNAASSGILIYMSLVDLLAADFMNPRIQRNERLQLWYNVFLFFGAGCMSLLAKWA
ncbi:hypothetical protein MLD38_023982 [Melastoma candidum]|uniref:Uncharacterized protein n=1 Tax=Melastoma candidum TaxID=119954 RepID=A0ACB9NTV2_9MYRT|nr:hypothetical protein MLD38_023982 [Melastoma candidum]